MTKAGRLDFGLPEQITEFLEEYPGTKMIIIDTLARCLLPKIQQYYESDEGKADLEKYRAEKENGK